MPTEDQDSLPEDLPALLAGRHGVPGRLLGPRVLDRDGDGRPRSHHVRAFLPTAKRAWLVAADPAGLLYVTDQGNALLRVVNASSGLVRTLAGVRPPAAGLADGAASVAKFNSPQGVAADVNGVVWVADRANNLLHWVNATNGTTYVLAGTPANRAKARVLRREMFKMFIVGLC
jgi:streptogramin lyase